LTFVVRTHLPVELSPDVTWHGRAEDIPRLVASILANCRCPSDGSRVCDAHQMLGDQHALDHLAFGLSVRWRLVAEEAEPRSGMSRAEKAEWSAWLAACRAPGHIRRPATGVPAVGLARAIGLGVLALALILGGLRPPRQPLPRSQTVSVSR
jgi:hypothetical protein